jgi:hypothetical protein
MRQDAVPASCWTPAPDNSAIRARRPVSVTLAARGRKACEVAARTVSTVEAEWAEHLGARRTEQLRTAIEALREVTEPYRA